MSDSSYSILGLRNKDFNPLLDPKIPRIRKTQAQTETLANYLVDKFNSPEFKSFFLKAAWRLTEQRIMEIVEQAFKPTVFNQRAYFISSVKKEPEYNI